MAHAELGASGAYRWMACPGSIRLSRGLPSTTSDFARAGTVAHELAEGVLRNGLDPEDVIGVAVSDDHPDIVVDQEMVDAVAVYRDHALELQARLRGEKDGLFLIEEKVDLSPMGGIGGRMFGTADLIVFVPSERTLYVRDYKHGSGVPVEVEGNAQLRYYALGAALRVWNSLGRLAPIRHVDYGVVQPRCPHTDGPIRTEVIDMVDLMDWGYDLLVAAERTEDPDAPVNPGDHCRFCQALSVCPAVRDRRMGEAKLVFAEDGTVEPEAPLETLSVEELRAIVDNGDQIIAWVKAAQQMAQTRLETGLPMPGYKLVAKRATRSWVDEKQALQALCDAFGASPDDLYKKTFLSPAQVEKALRLGKADKDVISALTESISSGTTLAPEGDKRPAVEASPRPDVEDVLGELD
jgi:hypothetical protein